MKTKFCILILTFFFWQISAQKTIASDSISRKKLQAIKKDQNIKIDGILDDEIWRNVPIATNFVERQPNNGKPQADSLKTEVKFLYDDTGLYIAAQMYDPQPSKILKELTERDNIANDDFFGIIINGYNDHQQSLEFIVTAAGVQVDGKLTTENEDMSWNAVWYSAVKINDKGWAVEMKIPFFELRFPKKDLQEFGLNMIRKIKRTNTMYDWNHVDNQKGNYTLYDGVLNGVAEVKTPTRLSFTPYFSTYVNSYDGKTEMNVNGGMDLKYGINDAFTFDMTLIPDFGQANFDNSILNLTPFEQQFAEQRSFFMEGTELFSKGDLFYSRRVGGSPSRYPIIDEEKETITEYPAKVKLFNAFKISGRTKKGLGIGIFNGVTEKMEATIRDNETGATRKEVVEPWTNYNVLVFDQRFGDNSSVTLVNTSTLRMGDFRDANSTGLLWNIANKKNTYNYYGNMKGSWVMDDGTKFGNRGTVGIGKFSGKNRFEINANYVNKDWDINDLGFSTKTNYGNHNVWYGYRILQPTEKLNNMYLNFNLNYYHRLEPFLNQKLIFNHNNSFTNKKFQSFGGGIEFTPYGEKDIYEPRTFGRYLNVPGYFDSWLWFESDSRKKLQYNITVDYYAYDQKGRNYVVPSLYLRYRASDKMKIIWQFNPVFSNNEVGYSGKDSGNIYMGRRQRNTYENAITGQYTFNEKMTLALAFRHYFADVTYKQFYTLENDGNLNSNTAYNPNLNGTYNSWNVDLRYSWWFAPGSQLTLLYRNATSNYLETSRMKFKNNFDELFNVPMINNFSLRISYFLDYNRMKNWF
ncbi:DUF5916 domain-containing protein [Epilithonimonas zeae]|uniref:DUF5916 domain-containing protein n=1 Tax=Epilithonimonas zeae TaxID=1416779 RepID=UPI0020103D85|nr:DUF5916 domain-containing protein [Epilithonimonas zeae]UQB70010.1 carbohydrate binding family 9 domain-containing protein [Epilithonimonas zeae]